MKTAGPAEQSRPFPVLTAAVLREMAKTMEIVSVEGGIAPSPYAGIGLNVMRAVVGSEIGVKASGGVRSFDDLKKMVCAGATRIGASASVKIMEQAVGAAPVPAASAPAAGSY